MCVCALGVRALLISVFCCFGPFCGRGRPQDLVERVGFEISCRNQGSLPSGIGSEAIFGGGGPPRGSSLCHTKKRFLCSPAVPEINIVDRSPGHSVYFMLRNSVSVPEIGLPGRNRSETIDFHRKLTVRTLPRIRAEIRAAISELLYY